METTIPFMGFYNSVHDAQIDDVIEMEASDPETGCHVDQEKFDEIFSKTDFKAVHEAYAKEFCERFAEEIEVKLTFKLLSSPKYYNYETDRIIAEIELPEVERIFNSVGKNILQEKIAERFTSRSGFISHYPNSLDKWPKDLAEWDLNHIGTLIEVYAESIHGWDHDKEVYLIDSAFEIVAPHLNY